MRRVITIAALVMLAAGPAIGQVVQRLNIPRVENRTTEILNAFNAGSLPVGTTATLTLQSPSGPGGAKIELDDFQRVRPADNAADSHPEPQRSLIRIKWN